MNTPTAMNDVALSSNGITNPDQCTGCLLCREICPVNAIKIRHDTLGFLYPDISEDKCTKCRACEDVCASLISQGRTHIQSTRKYYAAINCCTEIVKKSGSGGTFSAIADRFTKNGDVIYGAAFQTGFKVSHERAANSESLSRLMGTKYTQSYIADIYESIAADLSDDLHVLFVGTPCQCAAIRAYLKRKNISDERLYIVDIFCHGVFSPKIWQEYIELLEDKFGEKITYVSFRDKNKGWRNKSLKITTLTNDISDYCNNHASVLRLYEQNISFRESCYRCPYMCLDRVGDMSIGDFWGIERIQPRLDKNTGISAIIVTTQKGKELLDNIESKMNITEFEQADIMQQVLREPTKKNSRRDCFIQDYENGGVKSILSKYGQVKGRHRAKRDIIVPLLYRLRIAGFVSRLIHLRDD